MKLTSVQKKIINQSGNVIVRASAGTGKTHTMVTKIFKDIDNNNSHKVIAAITFTIKATKEIKDRLNVDTTHQFIGTNNTFAIEEIIKPFISDIYGEDYICDIGTDYSVRVDDFEDGMEEIRFNQVLVTYKNTKRNFIFELAYNILDKSKACQNYLKSKYFKMYIDEYQDCDKDMHLLFMYIVDVLDINLFIVGDEKQSIYMWRGAYPEAFNSIWKKPKFNGIFMGENFRSCKQVQNYANILFDETSHLYEPLETNENIIFVKTCENILEKVSMLIDSDKTCALLRFRKNDAKTGAISLSKLGNEFTYIPTPPIFNITSNSAWIYSAIVHYCILECFSIYDFISEIPVEADESKKENKLIEGFIKNIKELWLEKLEKDFNSEVKKLIYYLGYQSKETELNFLYETLCCDEYHSAFQTEKYQNISITFHSSKGLEFDQVLVFAEDYTLDNIESIYNHYVAVTRAKNKLIIIQTKCSASNRYCSNLSKILKKRNISAKELMIGK